MELKREGSVINVATNFSFKLVKEIFYSFLIFIQLHNISFSIKFANWLISIMEGLLLIRVPCIS